MYNSSSILFLWQIVPVVALQSVLRDSCPLAEQQLVPVRESLVLFPNMSSVAFMGAVSLASMVSTFPVEQRTKAR